VLVNRDLPPESTRSAIGCSILVFILEVRRSFCYRGGKDAFLLAYSLTLCESHTQVSDVLAV
jgi:hypothetical protein